MKNLTIICGTGISGKSLLAQRLGVCIGKDKASVKTEKLTRENMKRLATCAGPNAVVIFEMVPGYEIWQVIQDMDFYTLIDRVHVIITTSDMIYKEALVEHGGPTPNFLIQIIHSTVIFPK